MVIVQHYTYFYNINMKPIQVLMDDKTLQAFDQDEEVKRKGRSQVIRRLTAEYLKRKEAREISARYKKAYGGAGTEIQEELDDWEEEGVWPET